MNKSKKIIFNIILLITAVFTCLALANCNRSKNAGSQTEVKSEHGEPIDEFSGEGEPKDEFSDEREFLGLMNRFRNDNLNDEEMDKFLEYLEDDDIGDRYFLSFLGMLRAYPGISPGWTGMICRHMIIAQAKCNSAR